MRFNQKAEQENDKVKLRGNCRPMSTELMGAQHPNSKIPIIFDVATTIKNKNDIFSFHFFFSDPEPKQNIKTKTLFLDSLNPKADDNQNQWRYL